MTKWTNPNDNLPEKKNGWNHSERVLVFYKGNEHDIDCYGIAYYHYDPPFGKPCFVDFARYGRQPTLWALINPPEL